MLCSLAAYSHSAFLFCCILCLVVTHFGAYAGSALFLHLLLHLVALSLHITFHSQIHISCTSFLPFPSFHFLSLPSLFLDFFHFLLASCLPCCMSNMRDPIGTQDGIEFSFFFFFTYCISQSSSFEDFFFYFSTVLLWSVLALRDELLTRCTFARLRYIISCGTYSNLIFVAKQKGWRDNCISPGEKRICWTPPSFLRKSPPLLPQCEMSLV